MIGKTRPTYTNVRHKFVKLVPPILPMLKKACMAGGVDYSIQLANARSKIFFLFFSKGWKGKEKENKEQSSKLDHLWFVRDVPY